MITITKFEFFCIQSILTFLCNGESSQFAIFLIKFENLGSIVNCYSQLKFYILSSFELSLFPEYSAFCDWLVFVINHAGKLSDWILQHNYVDYKREASSSKGLEFGIAFVIHLDWWTEFVSTAYKLYKTFCHLWILLMIVL